MRHLSRGDRVGIAAPSSPVDEEIFSRGIRLLEDAGFKVEWNPSLLSSKGYLAGSDERRVNELNGFILDVGVKAVFIARGGYGLLRIIDRIDFEALRMNPKPFIGFSDSTALISYISSALNVFSLHGAMAATSAILDGGDSHIELIFRILTDKVEYPHRLYEGLIPEGGTSHVEGEICGGCLSVLCSLLATPYFPYLGGKILFLEEVGEKAYRVDRLVTQLRLAGVFEEAKAVLMGRFVPVKGERGAILENILIETCRSEGISLFTGYPGGHEGENLPLPLGVPARIEIQGDRADLLILESPFQAGKEG